MADVKFTGLPAGSGIPDNGSLCAISTFDGVTTYVSEKYTMTQLKDIVYVMEAEDKISFVSTGTNKVFLEQSSGEDLITLSSTYLDSLGFNGLTPDKDDSVSLKEARFDASVKETVLTSVGSSSYASLGLDSSWKQAKLGLLESGVFDCSVQLAQDQSILLYDKTSDGLSKSQIIVGGEYLFGVSNNRSLSFSLSKAGGNNTYELYAEDNVSTYTTPNAVDNYALVLSSRNATVNAGITNAVIAGGVGITANKDDYIFSGKHEMQLATEDFSFEDSGSVGATEQDWIEVSVGGVTGYVRVYATK